MRQAKFVVTGLQGEESIQHLQEALASIGVEGRVDLTTGSVEVAFDETTLSLEEINQVIAGQGYEVM
ncbi:heavy-metal-associated domain-containing protein [Marininema halotolerans]|uniref:Uncharacterized protein n=1 Tax=Marininema halotolerans TaxID=1155944 RepID=A0A1I6S4E0_9BACL|nr:heavy-metal-associated domain-containing protein [Marininema halotolerans]SFS71753.1 hypothetical protein SAMN05444972_106134 [Marininema halotolerans]